MCRSILVPLDGSAVGEQALPLAVDIARRSGRRCTSFISTRPTFPRSPISRPTEAIVEIGAPVRSVLHYAASHGVDLITLATHGRGGIARFALGSVADKLARSAALPVLLYRPAPRPAAVRRPVGEAERAAADAVGA